MLKCNEQSDHELRRWVCMCKGARTFTRVRYATFIITSFRIIIFLSCTTFVIHRGYECFKKYMDKPEAIDLTYKFTGSDEIPFPSLTFCPYNTSFDRYLFILKLNKLDA